MLLALNAGENSKHKSPADVLEFWFGGGWGSSNDHLNSQEFFAKMMPLWFSTQSDGTPIDASASRAIDESCKPFAETVRACGNGEFDSQSEWQNPDGLYAQLIL